MKTCHRATIMWSGALRRFLHKKELTPFPENAMIDTTNKYVPAVKAAEGQRSRLSWVGTGRLPKPSKRAKRGRRRRGERGESYPPEPAFKRRRIVVIEIWWSAAGIFGLSMRKISADNGNILIIVYDRPVFNRFFSYRGKFAEKILIPDCRGRYSSAFGGVI